MKKIFIWLIFCGLLGSVIYDYSRTLAVIGFWAVLILIFATPTTLSYCKKHKNRRNYHKTKEWCNIIYGIITQKTNDIPVISTDDALRGKENAFFDNSLIEYYYEKRDYPVDNSISKHTKPDGEVFYDIRGRAFNRLDIEYFMELNNIKLKELFYVYDEHNYGNYNMYYCLNDKYFEIACGRFDYSAINIGLFEITEAQYNEQKEFYEKSEEQRRQERTRRKQEEISLTNDFKRIARHFSNIWQKSNKSFNKGENP